MTEPVTNQLEREHDMPEPQSPRLRRLLRELQSVADPGAILQAFWAEAERNGTPLIEPSPTNGEAHLVTFLWREIEPIEELSVVMWITPRDFPDKSMLRLPGTDIWYRSVGLRSDARLVYQFSPTGPSMPGYGDAEWEERAARFCPDPLNRERIRDMAGITEPVRESDFSSILSLPDATVQQWVGVRGEHPAGAVERHRFASSILGDERDIWVYTPHGSSTLEGAPNLLVLFDGDDQMGAMDVPNVLDTLHGAGAITPTMAVMIDQNDRATELPCNPAWADMLATELMPWLQERYRFTDDARRRITAGQSYGGLAAAWVALQHPEVLGSVISQSGSYWWRPDPFNATMDIVAGAMPEYCWLPREVAMRPTAPIRIWMEVGLFEDRSPKPWIPTMLSTSRHFRDVLIAKGYELTYQEYPGAHDYVCWRNSLGDALAALVGPDAF